jgi:hypothetical protein
MSELEILAYLAGLTDSNKGYIGIIRDENEFKEQLTVRMKQIEGLDKFKETFGGSIKTQYGTKKTIRAFCYTAIGKDANKIIGAILPYLLAKRQEAELVMLLQSNNNPETLFRKVEAINRKRIRNWNPSKCV